MLLNHSNKRESACQSKRVEQFAEPTSIFVGRVRVYLTLKDIHIYNIYMGGIRFGRASQIRKWTIRKNYELWKCEINFATSVYCTPSLCVFFDPDLPSIPPPGRGWRCSKATCSPSCLLRRWALFRTSGKAATIKQCLYFATVFVKHQT